jgi:hypothetical protein
MDRWGVNESDGSGPLPGISIILGLTLGGIMVFKAYNDAVTKPSFGELAIIALMYFCAGVVVGLPVSCMLK